MIQGYVDKHLQAKVPLAILYKTDQISAIEAVVDTGFSGHLCISVSEIHKIDLAFIRSEKFELGDGNVVDQDVFLGQIIFDNQKIFVNVLVSTSRDTLIGTSLLSSKKLEVDYPKQTVRIRNSRKRKI